MPIRLARCVACGRLYGIETPGGDIPLETFECACGCSAGTAVDELEGLRTRRAGSQ